MPLNQTDPAFARAAGKALIGIMPGGGEETIHYRATDGLTARQYAAIHLRVPDSGEDWLDRMIIRARQMDAAEQCLAALPHNQADITAVFLYEKANFDYKQTAESPCKE